MGHKFFIPFALFVSTMSFANLYGQKPEPSFVYQYFPKSSSPAELDILKNSVQSLLSVRYNVFYDSTFLKICQVTDSPDLTGLTVNFNNNISLYLSLISDSVFLVDSNNDFLLSYKLLFPALKQTSESKIISGYNCKKFLYLEEDLSKFEIWMSEELPAYVNLGVTDRNLQSGLVSIINREHGEIRLVSFKGRTSEQINLPRLPSKTEKDAFHPLLKN